MKSSADKSCHPHLFISKTSTCVIKDLWLFVVGNVGWNICFLGLLTRDRPRDRMRENAFDRSMRRGEMSYSAFHYFHFVGVYFLFWPMSVGPQLTQSRLTVLHFKFDIVRWPYWLLLIK